ncbi:19218_t:CDS:2, partial [Racocetra persica]
RTVGVRIDESTVSRILKTGKKQLNSDVFNSNTKHHRSVTVSEVELALKEFVLNYQYKTILSDAMLVKKAKLLAAGIRQIKLQGKAASADNATILNALLLIQFKCAGYPLDRIYNIDKTGLFYRLEPDRTLATHRIARHKVDRERILIALYANADGSHKLNPLIDDLATMIENLYFSDPMQVEEFLSILNENIAYEIPDDDHAISELIEIFKKSNDIEDSDVIDIDETDNSLEIPMISADSTLEGLETTYMYLLQQDNISEQLKL